MKQAKHFRSLEELWDLEDRYPLVDANAAGLLRWMFATGMFSVPSSNRQARARRTESSSRRNKNGGH